MNWVIGRDAGDDAMMVPGAVGCRAPCGVEWGADLKWGRSRVPSDPECQCQASSEGQESPGNLLAIRGSDFQEVYTRGQACHGNGNLL